MVTAPSSSGVNLEKWPQRWSLAMDWSSAGVGEAVTGAPEESDRQRSWSTIGVQASESFVDGSLSEEIIRDGHSLACLMARRAPSAISVPVKTRIMVAITFTCGGISVLL